MFTSTLYTFFFLSLDLLIYLVLIEKYKLGKKSIQITSIVVVISLVIHSGLLQFTFLKSSEDFFNLLFFSAGLIILYFLGNYQVAKFKSLNQTSDLRSQ
jgi:hypothetical protein